MNFVVLHPDGRREEHELPADSSERLSALQEAVGGYIEYLSPAFHTLSSFEVVINEDGLNRLPVNVLGSKAIGMDLRTCNPLSGLIVLVPVERDLSAERQAEAHFFGRLEAVSSGLVSEEEAGFGFVIDAR